MIQFSKVSKWYGEYQVLVDVSAASSAGPPKAPMTLSISTSASPASASAVMRLSISTSSAEYAIREAAREPGFLAGVLDHMLDDESLLLAFADSAGLDPASIARARRALGGPQWDRDLP